jgi:mercuric ion binding protein
MIRLLPAFGFAAAVLAGGVALAAERTVTLAVDNMSCLACPYIVEQSLARVQGVKDVTVSFEAKTATVAYDDQETTPAALTDATEAAGYPSRVLR